MHTFNQYEIEEIKVKFRRTTKTIRAGVKGSHKRNREDGIEEDENASLEIWYRSEVKPKIRPFISGTMDLHKEYTSVMMSKEEKKRLKRVFFNVDVYFSKHFRYENTESMRLGRLW